MAEPIATPAPLDALRKEILGTLGPKVAAVAPSVSPLAASFAYGEIWPRPGLAPRDRSIATIAALVTLQCTEELRLHTLRGLANGISKEEIGELLTQLVPYVGFPLVVAAAADIADLIERAEVPPVPDDVER